MLYFMGHLIGCLSYYVHGGMCSGHMSPRLSVGVVVPLSMGGRVYTPPSSPSVFRTPRKASRAYMGTKYTSNGTQIKTPMG